MGGSVFLLLTETSKALLLVTRYLPGATGHAGAWCANVVQWGSGELMERLSRTSGWVWVCRWGMMGTGPEGLESQL